MAERSNNFIAVVIHVPPVNNTGTETLLTENSLPVYENCSCARTKQNNNIDTVKFSLKISFSLFIERKLSNVW